MNFKFGPDNNKFYPSQWQKIIRWKLTSNRKVLARGWQDDSLYNILQEWARRYHRNALCS